MDYAQDGEMTDYTPEDIADAALWEGEAMEFTDALIGAGFLDRDDAGTHIHDWYEYVGRLIAQRENNRERMKRARAANKQVTVQAAQETCGERAANVQDTCGATIPNLTIPNLTIPDHNNKYINSARDNACAHTREADAEHGKPITILTLNDNSEYPIFEEQAHEWAALYPAVDVIQQLRKMKGWLDANPAKRKTKDGIQKFINGWLTREQDKGVSSNGNNSTKGHLTEHGTKSSASKDITLASLPGFHSAFDRYDFDEDGNIMGERQG